MNILQEVFSLFCNEINPNMDLNELNEDVPIMYSNEKLKMLLEESGLPVEKVFETYIKGLKYETINDFPLGMSWFNTDEPLSFKKHLKGKLVLLDFFTYCCINCMHILPDLREIEHTFSVEDGLVVIGVHSAKFANEKQADNVKNAVLRYNIDHAVVNDDYAKMWQQCDIHCWPSLLLISPEGQPLVLLMGEGHRDTLKLYIKQFLIYFKAKINRQSLPIVKTADVIQHQEPLLFPGKLKAFEDRLCISDSGNNRIIIIDNIQNPEKKTITTIGSPCGELGFHDGGFAETMFNQPQGVVFLNKDVIFVADTENHAIRRVEIQLGIVSTIAGNGTQSFDRNGGRIGTQQGISSPWDLEIFRTDDGKSVLLVAMAGTHQIWAVFLEDTKWWKGKEYVQGMVACIAGSGREENKNNNYPNNAAFAQPSGLALDQKEKMLFIADSESSSVRKLSLVEGKVSALVGGEKNPNDLFAYGDVDGIFYSGKLQHCLGLCTSLKHPGKIYVADTYNHKIKVINTLTNHLTTLTIPANVKTKQTGKHTFFNEPSGLTQASDGKLYIADTNNHKIQICTLNADGDEIIDIDTLLLENIALQQVSDDTDKSSKDIHTLPTIFMCSTAFRKSTFLNITLNLCESGLHWTEDAPQKITAKSIFDTLIVNCEHIKESKESGKQHFKLTLTIRDDIKTSSDIINATCYIYTCKGDLCFNNKFTLQVPVTINDPTADKTVIKDEIHVNVDVNNEGICVN